MKRLSRPEILENIMAAAPRLAEDPIAVSIIKDPELLIQLGDVNTIKRIVKSHPILAEAAYCIEAAIDEESWSPEATNPGTSSGYSYSLDALSDDEEVDSSQVKPLVLLFCYKKKRNLNKSNFDIELPI